MVRRLVTGEFDEGSEYATFRRHGTTDWLLVQTLHGRGRFGQPAEVTGSVAAVPGSVTLVRPGVLHDYGTVGERWHFLYAHLHPKPDWLPLLDWPEVAPGILQLHPTALFDQIANHLRDAVRHQRSVLPQAEQLSVNSLEAALLWCDTQNPKAVQIDDRLLRAIELVDQDLTAALDVPRLARAVNLSVSRFAHLFREQLGVTPQQFVERRRLDAAARLLELTSRSVASVAAQVGYADPLYFSTRFRLHTGTSPTTYRRRS